MYADKLEGEITPDRRLIVTLPDDALAGAVEVILLYVKPRAKRKRRAKGRSHPAFGLWAKRADLRDSAALASELRQRMEQRADGGR